MYVAAVILVVWSVVFAVGGMWATSTPERADKAVRAIKAVRRWWFRIDT